MSDPLKPAAPSSKEGSTPVGGGWQTEIPATDPSPNVAPTLAEPTTGGDSLVTQTFGDFELTQVLGRGGMGVVYKARQKSLDRDVALKLLLPEHAGNPVLLTRFLVEARAAARLSHPNIVPVYQVGECAAGPYFVMEYIDGRSLDTLVGRQLPVAWSAALVATVADAVEHAHSKGIIHRDLKPGNILLHQSRRPMVMDFGIAKVMGKGSGLTMQGVVVGTPAYMPPEQAGEDPAKIGPHSDVYSLGAILYVLLTGRTPFSDETPLRTLLQVVAPNPPEAISRLRPEVPRQLEQICMKCLEKDPAKRYPTARALAEDLRRIRPVLTAKPPPAPPPLPIVTLIISGGKQVRLSGKTTVIGRAADCDLPIKAGEVSKHHCRITLTPEVVTVEDLGSSNGTFVNGAQIQQATLADGDKLDLGGKVLRVRVEKPKVK
jgi:serine/threonine protein kinase